MESEHPLRLWMKRKRLNQRQFAGMMGCSEVTVSRWLTSRRLPRPADMLKIEKLTERAVRPGDWYPKAEAAE